MSTPFHVSQAVLDVNTATGDEVQLILKSDKVDYILCILRKSQTVQVPLNLIFSEGDEISFRSVGKLLTSHSDASNFFLPIHNPGGTVHLTGYLEVDDDFPGLDDGESSDADEEVPQLVPATQKQKLKAQVVQEQDSSSENENSAESQGEDGSDDDDDDEVDDDSEEDDDSDEEINEPPPKMAKIPNGTNGIVKKEDKHKDNKQKKQQQPTEKSTKTLQGDVKVEDIRVGQGAVAKNGKKVQVSEIDQRLVCAVRFLTFSMLSIAHRSTTRVALNQTTKSSTKRLPAKDSSLPLVEVKWLKDGTLVCKAWKLEANEKSYVHRIWRTVRKAHRQLFHRIQR